MSVVVETHEPSERKPWSSGMAPAYIGTFLWVAFFDGLGARALPVGGLIPSLLGVVWGSILAYLLLYRVPASWAFKTGRGLDGLAESTFGDRGGRVVPNLAIGLGQVVLFAVAVGVATGWMLDGLLFLGMIEPRGIRPVRWNGGVVPSPLFLTAALVWGVVTALAAVKIVRWIAAIMRYFPVFPAICLAVVVAENLSGLGDFQPTRLDPITGRFVGDSGTTLAFLTTLQWTFGFTALLGITGADWGAASLSRSDVHKGGWISIAFAPVIVASLAFLAVVGHQGKINLRAEARVTPPPANQAAPPLDDRESALGGDPPADNPTPSSRYTFRSAVEDGFNRRVSAAILLIFGLASLAPACYAAFGFGRRFSSVGLGLSKLAWTLVGVAAAWFLILGGWHERTDVLFSVLGAIYAPVAGAIVADATRQRPSGGWNGPRPGINPAGMLAWSVGFVVGLAPVLAGPLGWDRLAQVAPAALLAFLAAFVVYWIAAAIGLESKAVAAPAPLEPTP